MLKYKEILKQRAPKIYAIFKYFILYFINKSESYPEKKVRYGKANLKITFYVIRRTPPGAGFFSNYHHVMGHIIIALEKGYLPIVDMENYETYYNVSNFINGSKNSWEYYFEQPSCFNLEEVYNSKNVILSSGSFPYNIDCELGFVYDKKIIKKHNDIISKYIKIKKSVQDIIDNKWRNLIRTKTNILGVSSRGTDILTTMGKGHKVQPPTSALIALAKSYLTEWGMEWIYLASEELGVVNDFRAVFGERLIVTDSARVCEYDGKTPIVLYDFHRENDNYIKGLEYLVDIAILSRCDSILSTITNGSVAAIEMNGNRYINSHIIDLGIY